MALFLRTKEQALPSVRWRLIRICVSARFAARCSWHGVSSDHRRRVEGRTPIRPGYVFLTALGADETEIEALFCEAIRIAKQQKSFR